MGRRGRKPIPTITKMLNGNPGQRPLNHNEPQYRAIEIENDCPDELIGAARDEWFRMLHVIGKQRLITAGDRAAFTVYCQACGEYIAAQRIINSLDSLFIQTKSTYKAHPILAIRDKAAARLLKLAVEFGLTPSSRSGISLIDESAQNEIDKYEKFVNDGYKLHV